MLSSPRPMTAVRAAFETLLGTTLKLLQALIPEARIAALEPRPNAHRSTAPECRTLDAGEEERRTRLVVIR